MNGVWGAAVAVIGTLSGVAMTAFSQNRRERAALRRAARSEALAAVTSLLAALAAHRRAMWIFEDARLASASRSRIDETRAIRHETREAIEMPLHTVSILVPALTELAEAAAQAVYGMRAPATAAALAASRVKSLAAHQRLVQAARDMLTADQFEDVHRQTDGRGGSQTRRDG